VPVYVNAAHEVGDVCKSCLISLVVCFVDSASHAVEVGSVLKGGANETDESTTQWLTKLAILVTLAVLTSLRFSGRLGGTLDPAWFRI